jgi:hypothetical protein
VRRRLDEQQRERDEKARLLQRAQKVRRHKDIRYQISLWLVSLSLSLSMSMSLAFFLWFL